MRKFTVTQWDKESKKYLILLLITFFSIFMLSPIVTAIEEITIQRNISEPIVNSGDEFTVTVNIVSNKDITPPLLNESIPIGWTAIRVSDDAAFFKNPGDGFVRWVWFEGMHQGSNKVVTYRVKVPENVSGKYQFAGILVTNEIDGIGVKGDYEVTVKSMENNDNSGSNSSVGGNSPEPASNVEVEELSQGLMIDGNHIKNKSILSVEDSSITNMEKYEKKSFEESNSEAIVDYRTANKLKMLILVGLLLIFILIGYITLMRKR